MSRRGRLWLIDKCSLYMHNFFNIQILWVWLKFRCPNSPEITLRSTYLRSAHCEHFRSSAKIMCTWTFLNSSRVANQISQRACTVPLDMPAVTSIFEVVAPTDSLITIRSHEDTIKELNIVMKAIKQRWLGWYWEVTVHLNHQCLRLITDWQCRKL